MRGANPNFDSFPTGVDNVDDWDLDGTVLESLHSMSTYSESCRTCRTSVR